MGTVVFSGAGRTQLCVQHSKFLFSKKSTQAPQKEVSSWIEEKSS